MALFLLDKPIGISSNKALSEFKKEHNVSKAGFSGVLDPFASGLLIIATGMDTRLLDIFLHKKKTYTGTILFGRSTDTYDTEGVTTEEMEVNITLEQIKESIEKNFLGDIMQTPPVYSNIKVHGKRARELALKGEEVILERKPRHIYKFEITNFNNNEATFEVEVSSGTYIRSLAYDLGRTLNSPSMLTELRRTKIGDIEVDNKEIDPYLASEMKIIEVDNLITDKLLNGKVVDIKEKEEQVIVKSDSNVIWVRKQDGFYKIHKRLR